MKKLISNLSLLSLVLFIGSCAEDELVPVEGDFTADAQSIRAGETISFTSTVSGDATGYLWTFEGGTPFESTEQNVSVLYTTPGTYNVTLKVSNGRLNDEVVKEGYITVANSVEASFSSNTQLIGTGSTITFQETSVGDPDFFEWVFQGGSPSFSTASTQEVTYFTAGFYDVTLYVEDAYGSDQVTIADYIEVRDAVSASFSEDDRSIAVGESVSFTDFSSGPTEWSWIFEGGDPETSTAQNPVVTYDSAGIFDVTLVVSDGLTVDSLVQENRITVFVQGIDLVISEYSFEADSVEAGRSLFTEYRVNNVGNSSSGGSSIIAFWLSDDNVLDNSDTNIGFQSVGFISALSFRSGTINVSIPSTTQTGDYFLFAVADNNNTISEANENNNRSVLPLRIYNDN